MNNLKKINNSSFLYKSPTYGLIIFEKLNNGNKITYNPSFDGVNFTSSNPTNTSVLSYVSFELLNKMFKLKKWNFIEDVLNEALAYNEKIT